MRYWIMVFIIASLAVLLIGCGGSGRSGSPPATAAGSVGVRIAWPPESEVQTALIPTASYSIKVELLQGGVVLSGLAAVINRPNTSARIDGVPPGDTLLRVSAHPQSEARGVAQAFAERNITVVSGEYSEWALTLETTITDILVTPTEGAVRPTQQLQFTGTALNANDEIVLLPTTAPFTWQITSGGSFASVNSNGLVTGLDTGTATIQATEKDTNLVGEAIVEVTNSPTEGGYEFVREWGPKGNLEGQIGACGGIAVDAFGNCYISDSTNHRIQKFTSEGVYVSGWGGTAGSGDGQLDTPYGIAFDPLGNLYVADTGNNRIQKFTSNGIFITKWGSTGSGNGQFMSPIGVAVDHYNVYVVDNSTHCIQIFNPDGTFLEKWESLGPGDAQFYDPIGIATGSTAGLPFAYVADRGNGRVLKCRIDGSLEIQWGTPGVRDGQFGTSSPQGIAVDVPGNIYVVDRDNYRIQKFNHNYGNFITKWLSKGSGELQFINRPEWIAVDDDGNVHVSQSSSSVSFLLKTFRPEFTGAKLQGFNRPRGR
jgi:DNA-binding beta-propeller fold protein YncE